MKIFHLYISRRFPIYTNIHASSVSYLYLCSHILVNSHLSRPPLLCYLCPCSCISSFLFSLITKHRSKQRLQDHIPGMHLKDIFLVLSTEYPSISLITNPIGTSSTYRIVFHGCISSSLCEVSLITNPRNWQRLKDCLGSSLNSTLRSPLSITSLLSSPRQTSTKRWLQWEWP